jgi:hypothetical protein
MLRLITLSSLLAVAACSAPPANEPSDAGTEDSQDSQDSPAPISSQKDASTATGTLSFTPTNFKNIDFGSADTFKIDGNCEFDTDRGTVDCKQYGAVQFQVVTQSDPNRTEIGLFTVSSLTIGPNAVVSVVGSRPIAIVSEGEIFIQGALMANADGIETNTGNAGGFSAPAPASADKIGNGPGGGGAPTGNVGGGGGGYCGKGGNANGGQPYGNPAIAPLMGGSSGAVTGGWPGAGGGAVQLVSNASITLAPLGKINAGGGGGAWMGNGGGSGGAVLLEAPTVTIQGTIAANGGGGGANSIDNNADGQNGTSNATGAPGGVNPNSPSENPGGQGSAGSIIDGSAGQYTNSLGNIPMATYSGGGGGGAGRIRINTSSGQAAITGILSPSVGTTCVSQGKLAAQ